MAIEVKESEKSRKIEWYDKTRIKSADFSYDVTGTDDPLLAQAALAAAIPDFYGGLPIDNVSADPETADTANSTGLWRFSVRYTVPGGGAGESEEVVTVSFDTTGGTQHVTQSKQTKSFPLTAYQSVAPDYKGAIGVTHDSVEGVDITSPVFKFSVSVTMDVALVTPAYIGRLFRLTGKVNESSFHAFGMGTFNGGELLFLGATGGKRRGKYQMQYQFAASPDKTQIKCGDITVDHKRGWDYMWIQYGDRDVTQESVLFICKVPVAVYIEQVYEYDDFMDLVP